MKYLNLFCFCLITISQTIAQDIVKMEKSGGVYLIPCKVNGVPLKFIFDTGASDVSISLTEALFMLKNGYLKETDIKGSVYYSIANGEIAEGTRINIQKIEVGKQTMYNVEASIVHSTEAPLLFGQSAMERFGKFTMDYSNSNLIIGGSQNTSSNTINSSTINSVKIGTQTWMTENLNVDRFRNGDLIPEAKTDEAWKRAGENKQPTWCYYNNDPANGEKYGRLYNWYSVNDSRGLAPKGWHIPSDDEWSTLWLYKGAFSNKMKSVTGWDSFTKKRGCYNNMIMSDEFCYNCKGISFHTLQVFSGNGNNSSGFNAFPGGMRYANGTFLFINTMAAFWSSSHYPTGNNKAGYVFRSCEEAGIGVSSLEKGYAVSVRCIKD